MKLFPKLFLTFLFTASLLLIGMAALVNWSFHRGLEEYLHQTELEKLALVVPAIEDAYQQAGSWTILRQHKRWLRIRMRHALRDDVSEPPPLGEKLPRRPHDSSSGAPPQGFLLSRLRILDADKQVVIGTPDIVDTETLRPIQHDGTTVGWIALRRAHQISDQLALAFHSQQRLNFIIIAVLGLLVSSIVSFWLARQLLHPLQRITLAARQLGQGNYRARVADLKSGDELGQLAIDFNHLALSLERNEQARRQWIADISHELRTPLSILRGEIEALQDGVRQVDKETLHSLHQESLNLGKLVDDLYELALSDVGALDYRKEPVNAADILAQTLESFSAKFGAKNLHVDQQINGPIPVLADPQRLRQLFSNLLENTLRYTDADGDLRLSATVNPTSAILRFQDSAPGVEAAELDKLFERLYRVDKSRSRASGGAGLGLSICRNIVEAHGGTIHAVASPLGGLEIVLELPCLT